MASQNSFLTFSVSRKHSRSYVEKSWKKFSFQLTNIMWQDIYLWLCKELKNKKLCEVRYKLIHNVLICNKKLYKWKFSTSDACLFCKRVQNTNSVIG